MASAVTSRTPSISQSPSIKSNGIKKGLHPSKTETAKVTFPVRPRTWTDNDNRSKIYAKFLAALKSKSTDAFAPLIKQTCIKVIGILEECFQCKVVNIKDLKLKSAKLHALPKSILETITSESEKSTKEKQVKTKAAKKTKFVIPARPRKWETKDFKSRVYQTFMQDLLSRFQENPTCTQERLNLIASTVIELLGRCGEASIGQLLGSLEVNLESDFKREAIEDINESFKFAIDEIRRGDLITAVKDNQLLLMSQKLPKDKKGQTGSDQRRWAQWWNDVNVAKTTVTLTSKKVVKIPCFSTPNMLDPCQNLFMSFTRELKSLEHLRGSFDRYCRELLNLIDECREANSRFNFKLLLEIAEKTFSNDSEVWNKLKPLIVKFIKAEDAPVITIPASGTIYSSFISMDFAKELKANMPPKYDQKYFDKSCEVLVKELYRSFTNRALDDFELRRRFIKHYDTGSPAYNALDKVICALPASAKYYEEG